MFHDARRAVFSFLFLLRVETNQAMMPPIRSGVLSSCGMYIPSAKASGGTLRYNKQQRNDGADNIEHPWCLRI